MKRRILIPLDDDEIRNDEIERINRETRRLEEKAAHVERLGEAIAARYAAEKKLQRAVEQQLTKVELQKVDTAKFVFLWENSTSVMDVAVGMLHPDYMGGVFEDDIALAKELAKVIRTVEKIPLRELPDERPAVKRSSRLQNFS
jgi:hypothetical protein